MVKQRLSARKPSRLAGADRSPEPAALRRVRAAVRRRAGEGGRRRSPPRERHLQARRRDSGPGSTVEYWIGAVPTTWNVVPSGTDPMLGTTFDPAKTTMQTAIYRRFTADFKNQLPPAGYGLVGPIIQAQVGDTIIVHFKNFDPNNPHSMHFHGVHYDVDSDGAYIPNISGPGRRREAGRRPSPTGSRPAPDSAGVWPYHDHSPSMDTSIRGGLYGALSIRAQGAEEARPRVRRLLREAAQLQHDRRPRVHQQHADVPRQGRRRRAVGRARRSATTTTASTCTAIAG